ncbi:hypothetical protein [Streptomyces sp. NBC_00019]|uniref:hypothetical protein n=1 Tax=Streptomyces sp. NBC_00019 TaxID=2975623 RepID=UPI003249E6DB
MTVSYSRAVMVVDVARILDEHFARPDTDPGDLVGRFDNIYVPNRPNEQVTAAAVRAGDRVRTTGRWRARRRRSGWRSA